MNWFSDAIGGWCLSITLLLCAMISQSNISVVAYDIYFGICVDKNGYPNQEIREQGLYFVTHIYNPLLYYHWIGTRTKLFCSFWLQGLVVCLVVHNLTMSGSVSWRNSNTALFHGEVEHSLFFFQACIGPIIDLIMFCIWLNCFNQHFHMNNRSHVHVHLIGVAYNNVATANYYPTVQFPSDLYSISACFS